MPSTAAKSSNQPIFKKLQFHMKTLFPLLLSFVSICAFAQKKLQVIEATSPIAYTKEGNEEKQRWNLNAKLKPDVYILNKSPKAKRITFYTDKDSINLSLRPGKHVDFVVLLNGKDSCFTRIESLPLKNFAKVKPQIHDTIPFALSAQHNQIFSVVLDGKDTLALKFDSGTSDFLLTNDVIKNQLKLTNLKGHSFDIGEQRWENQQIYPVELTGQGTVGRFGWNLFDGKIVEINYDTKQFIVHSKMPKITSGYEKLSLEYTNTLFCIRGSLQIKDKKYEGRFLFDSGYQRTIMLDPDLMQEQQYPKDSLKIIKKVIMKNGKGEEIPVLTVNNERLNLGNISLYNIPVQLLSTKNPARFKTHILGNEVLKRLNTILDFQHHVVYLKPNSLWNEPYTEAQKI